MQVCISWHFYSLNVEFNTRVSDSVNRVSQSNIGYYYKINIVFQYKHAYCHICLFPSKYLIKTMKIIFAHIESC